MSRNKNRSAQQAAQPLQKEAPMSEGKDTQQAPETLKTEVSQQDTSGTQAPAQQQSTEPGVGDGAADQSKEPAEGDKAPQQGGSESTEQKDPVIEGAEVKAGETIEPAKAPEQLEGSVKDPQEDEAEEEKEQEEVEEPAAQEQAPTPSSLYTPKKSAMVATLESVVTNYVEQMHPSRVATKQTIINQQSALFKALQTWIKLPDINDFLAFADVLMKTVSENRDTVFSGQYVNRGQEYIPLNGSQRRALASITNVLYSVTNADRKAGYAEAGNIVAQLRAEFGEENANRAAKYFQRYCSIA